MKTETKVTSPSNWYCMMLLKTSSRKKTRWWLVGLANRNQGVLNACEGHGDTHTHTHTSDVWFFSFKICIFSVNFDIFCWRRSFSVFTLSGTCSSFFLRRAERHPYLHEEINTTPQQETMKWTISWWYLLPQWSCLSLRLNRAQHGWITVTAILNASSQAKP